MTYPKDTIQNRVFMDFSNIETITYKGQRIKEIKIGDKIIFIDRTSLNPVTNPGLYDYKTKALVKTWKELTKEWVTPNNEIDTLPDSLYGPNEAYALSFANDNEHIKGSGSEEDPYTFTVTPNNVCFKEIIAPEGYFNFVGSTSRQSGLEVLDLSKTFNTEILDNQYSHPNLKKIILPPKVRQIGSRICAPATNLKTIILLKANPPVIQADTFDYLPANAKIYVLDKSLNIYKNATNWSALADHIYSINELPTGG